MHLTTRNVNTAFQTLIDGIEDQSIPTIKTPSRNGPVIQVSEPIILTYTNPRERVLFNQARDANPAFHLYESLWMLAGRNDVAPLKYYASKISDFSDDGETFNGAYGYRWRHAKEMFYGMDTDTEYPRNSFDQLTAIIKHLKADPNSRRAVLQMWNVEDDLRKIDAPNKSKDVCCNISVMFSIRTGDMLETGDGGYQALDMTVTNRSNDIIWGMLGANYVHFSFLQEYVACALGVEVGKYHHMSNNAHVYTETNSGWHPEKWLREYHYKTMHDKPALSYGKGPNDTSGNVGTSQYLFGEGQRELFDAEVKALVNQNYNRENVGTTQSVKWECGFLDRTVQPALHAFHMYKHRDFEAALYWCNKIAGADWRVACTNWIQKRKENFEKKLGGLGE